MNFNEFFSDNPSERPLEHLVSDGGYCGILRSVACIGDSLDSGEMQVQYPEGKMNYLDKYEYSWLSYFGRVTGNEIRHFSRGGMSTREYVETFADANGYWNPAKACHAYVITLGTNDISEMVEGTLDFGSIDDIDFNDYHNNRKTYAGYYGTIIQRYREISPRCRIFLTITFHESEPKRIEFIRKQQELLRQFTERFELCYVMDFFKYGPAMTEDFRRKFYMNGHMSPAGYLLKGRLYTSYIDYVIRHNLDDFTQIAMLGHDIHDSHYVW